MATAPAVTTTVSAYNPHPLSSTAKRLQAEIVHRRRPAAVAAPVAVNLGAEKA